MDSILDALAQMYSNLGYPEIIWLMALESSLFPVPSELVMIPAGYRAQAGLLNPWLAVACGALGSVIGACANYLLGRYVGRAFLLKYGRYVLVDRARYEEAEAMFLRNAALATFVGRLLPVVRHLISLPAGVFSMPWPLFVAITAAGSALWCGVLVALGYHLGEPAVALMRGYLHELALLVAVGLLVFVAWFLFHKARKSGDVK